MPLYEYVCTDCHSRFELLRPVSKSGEDAACVKCQKPARRKLSTFAAVSKSSGGESAPISGGGGGCSSCSSSNCGSCG